LIDENSSVKELKEKYKYLDSIDVYGITYLSDGLQIGGLMARPKNRVTIPVLFTTGAETENLAH
jgi:hypothetical protein